MGHRAQTGGASPIRYSQHRSPAAMCRSRVTGTFMVPAMIDVLAETPGFDGADLSSLRSIMVGGSPLSERSIRTWTDRGVKIVQGFGMTETAPGVCLLEAQDALSHAGTAGPRRAPVAGRRRRS